MAKVKHRLTTGLNIHVPYFAEYTDEATRIAGTELPGGGEASSADNVKKFAIQLDTGALYRLTNHSPITWAVVSDPVAVALAAAAAADAQLDADAAVADAAAAQATANGKLSPSGNLTGQVSGVAVATVVAGAAAGATASQPGTNHTGPLNGVTAATVTSGAAAGGTALQPAGTLTGNVAGTALIDGTAASAVKSGAAAGATALQPAGNLTGQVGGVAVVTVTAGAAIGNSIAGLGAGVLKNNGSSVISSATVVNADVAAGAAIAGSKVAPDFGAQNIVTTGNAALGTNPASAGDVRLSNAFEIKYRNPGNSADLSALNCTSSTLTLGDGASTLNLSAGGTGNPVNIQCTGSTRVSVAPGGVSFTGGCIAVNFLAPASTCTFGITSTSSAARQLTLKGQSSSSVAGVVAGKISIEAGDATGASGTRTGGDLDLRAGTGASANGVIRLLDGVTERIKIDGTGIGVFGATPAAKPAVTGSRGGNAALASLLTALATLGWITDSSTA